MLILAAACVAVYWPAWVPRTTFSGMDFLNLLYPQAFLVRNAFAAGEIPLWNWYTWNGSPLLAAMQSAPLYPPMWLTLLLPIPWALQLNVLVHLVIAGMGAVMIAERMLRVRAPIAVIAGIIYSCSGFLFGHLEQVNSIAAMSWAPWILLFSAELLEGKRRTLLLSLICGAALVAGHPQHVVLAIFFAELYALAWLAMGIAGRKRPQITRFFFLQGAYIVAGMLAAAQLLPTQELSSLSERVWPYDDPNEPALKWKFLPALIVPRFFNALANSPGQPLGYSELGLYAGVLGALLGFAGIVVALKQRPRNLPVIAVLVVSLLYALGRSGFITPIAFTVLPFLGQSRGAARALNVFMLVFAALAALGGQWFLMRLAAERARHFAIAFIALVLVLDFAITHRVELRHRLVSSAILNAAEPAKTINRLGATAPHRLYRFMMHDSDYYLDSSQRGVGQRAKRIQPNMNILWGIATIDGYEEGLLPPRHLANFLRRYNRNLRFATPDTALLGLLGSNQMITDILQVNHPTARKIRETEDLAIWQGGPSGNWFLDKKTLLTTAPAAKTANCYWSQTLRGGYSYDPPGQVSLEHPYGKLNASNFEDAARASGLRVTRVRTNGLEVQLAPGPPREILFLQTCFPGWKLEVTRGPDVYGQSESPVFSSWHLPAQAAPSPARFTYSPFSFRLGMFVSLAAMTVVFITATRRFRTPTQSA